MQISTIVIANPNHFQRNSLDEFGPESTVISCSFNITWLSPLAQRFASHSNYRGFATDFDQIDKIKIDDQPPAW